MVVLVSPAVLGQELVDQGLQEPLPQRNFAVAVPLL